MSMNNWSTRLAPLGLVVMGLASPQMSNGAIPSADGTISACASMPRGILRVIDVEAGQTCGASEMSVVWQSAAPTVALSCPSDTVASAGACIEKNARTAASMPTARQTCAEAGRRLPAGSELYAYRVIGTLATAGEWADDLGDITGTFKYFVVTQNGGNGVAEAFATYAYRCVTGPQIG